VAYIPHTVRKPLSRITDKLSLVCRAVRNEGNIAVFLSLIVYSCIPNHLLCIPVFCLELVIGQPPREVAIRVWNQVSPYLSAIGISIIVVFFSRVVYGVSLTKLEKKPPLGRTRIRCVTKNMTKLLVLRCGWVDWIELAPDRDNSRALVNAVMNHRGPYNAENYLTSCKPVSF